MNNWRLLLLAVVVVVQPIGSFTESNLIDGRECCERSEDSRLYGYQKIKEHRALDGNLEDTRTTNDRHLSLRERNLDRRYETRRGPMLTRSERSLERSERRFSPELSRYTEERFTRDQKRHQEIREDQNRNRDESRSSMGQESRNRDTLHATRTVKLTRDARDTRSEHESRNFMSRLPIRSSRNLEERRVSPNTDTTIKQERENIVRSATRRDTRLSAPAQYKSRMQLENNNRRTRKDTSVYRRSDARVGDEVRDLRAQMRSVEHKEKNNRDSRVVSEELRRQQNTELRDRVSVIRRDSERVSGDRMRDSRDDARIVRHKMETRNEKRTDVRRQQPDDNRRSMDTARERNTAERPLDSHLTRAARSFDMTRNDKRMERRSLSMGRLSTLRDSDRSSRVSERNARDERSARNSDVSAHIDGRQETRRTSSRTDVQESSEERRLLESRDTADTRRIVTRQDVSEQRKQRDSRLSRDRISSLRDFRDSDRRQESRSYARENLEDSILQRDNSKLSRDRTNYMLREKREVRDTTVNAEVLRGIAIDSRSRQDNRYNERSDLRRQVLERSMERAIRISEERRHDNRGTSRRSRSAEALRIREETRSVERCELRHTRDEVRTVEQRVNQNVATLQRLDTRNQESSKTESIRLDRIVRNRDEVRENRDKDRNGARTQKESHNAVTPQRLDARRSLRTESIRLERLVRDRGDVNENEKRDNNQASRIISNRPSERMLTERRQVNRETGRDARDVRLIRNRDEVKSKSTIAERMQENRETARDSRHVRVTRNRSQVRSERMLVERRQENHESTRDFRNFRGDVRSGIVLAERRQENRELTRDSRNIRDETRKQGEVRSQRVLTERRQENRKLTRDSRNVRDETRKQGEVRNQRVLADRRQENRELTRDSRNIRDETRKQGEVGSQRIFAERRQESRELTRDSRNIRDETRKQGEVGSQRVFAERRQESRELTRDSRNIRDETRKQDEVRSQRVLAERSQENRDSLDVRAEIRMDERFDDSRLQRDVTRDSRERFLRETRNTERLSERSTEQERPTRYREKEIRLIRNVGFSNNDAVTSRDKLDKTDESVFNSWHMIFYTLHGAYLCGLLLQMITENGNKTKNRTFNWWTSKNFIKLD